jgi:tripartite-type tricarboxylate transporter receptor subunit TctC
MDMKKLISLALALSMLLALAACTSSAPPAASAPPSAPAESAAPSESKAPEVSEPDAFVPERDITLVNPYEAGGTSDIPSRIYADFISKNMGGRLMNVNCIGGAGGAVGAQEVMNANADGYTILVAPAGYAMNYAKGGLDWTYEAFEPVCLYVTSVLAVAVRADSPYETYQDLVDAVKAAPGKVNMGIATGGLPQFSVYAMEAHDEMKFNTVDIGGTSVKATELLAGRVDVMIDSLGGMQSYVESGDFRLLAVFADSRHPAYPDVPTMLELGFAEDETSVMSQVFGIWAPKGTPAEAIDYIAGQFEAAANDPDTVEKLNAQCYTASFMDTEDYVGYLEAMYASFGDFAKTYLG